MTWKEPEYKLFDPETGHVELFDRCMNANALVVCYQEKRTGEAVGEPIFARAGTRADLNSYITSNRGRRSGALAEGRKIKRPSESKLAPIACSMLPRDYEITEKARYRSSPLRQQRHSITDSYGRIILLVHRLRSIELF